MKINKKIGILSTGASLMYIVLIYLSISFFHLSLNPEIWGEDSRFIFVMVGIFMGVVIGITIAVNLKD